MISDGRWGDDTKVTVFRMKPGVYSWCELHQVKAGLMMRLFKCGIHHVP